MAFILTGCTASYTVTINEDLTVSEEAKLAGTDDFYATYYKSTKKNVLKTQIDSYKDILDENNYQYELIEEEMPYVLVKKNFSSVNEYINSTLLFNDYFDEVKYTENGDIKRIETVGFNENNPENPDRFDIKELEIAIKCPFKVKDNNASRVDKKTNTYYYNLLVDNKIIFEYDTSKKFNPNADLLMTIFIVVGFIILVWLTVFIMNKKNK